MIKKNRIKKVINEQINLLEISDDLYELLDEKYSNSRLILTDNEEILFYPTTNRLKKNPKPTGLWYSFGLRWIDWVKETMPEWMGKNVFEIDINEENVLLIDNLIELENFNDEYVVSSNYLENYNIDWPRVSVDYSGIEIPQVFWKARNKFHWYNGWDVPSGCIWDSNGIKSIKKIDV